MYKYLLLLILPILLYANIGKILALKGDVKIQRGTTTLKAFNGIDLEEKDIIKTDKLAQAQIMLNDKTTITIGKNAIFEIQEYFYDKTKKSKVTMKMKKGIFYAISGKIGKINKSRFKLKTKSASISIRGTHFMGNISDTKETIGCSFGGISVTSKGQMVDVPAGSMTSFLSGSIPSPIVALDISKMTVSSKSKTQNSKKKKKSKKQASSKSKKQSQKKETSSQPSIPDSLTTDANAVEQDNTLNDTLSVAQTQDAATTETSTETTTPTSTANTNTPPPANTPPTLSLTLPATTTTQNTGMDISFSASDAEGSTTTVASSMHGDVTVNSSTNIIRYEPNTINGDFFGTDYISVQTTDDDNLATVVDKTIEVTSSRGAITHTLYEDDDGYFTFGIFAVSSTAVGDFLYNGDLLADGILSGLTIGAHNSITTDTIVQGLITTGTLQASYIGNIDGVVGTAGRFDQRISNGEIQINFDFSNTQIDGDFSFIGQNDELWTSNLSGSFTKDGFTISNLTGSDIQQNSTSTGETIGISNASTGDFYGGGLEYIGGELHLDRTGSAEKANLIFAAPRQP